MWTLKDTFEMCHINQPRRSLAKVMFLQASVILLTGGVSASVYARIPTPPPWELTCPRPRADPTGSRHPPRADTSLKQTPPWEADSGIRSMSGRYASYWNAFLLESIILFSVKSVFNFCASRIKENIRQNYSSMLKPYSRNIYNDVNQGRISRNIFREVIPGYMQVMHMCAGFVNRLSTFSKPSFFQITLSTGITHVSQHKQTEFCSH